MEEKRINVVIKNIVKVLNITFKNVEINTTKSLKINNLDVIILNDKNNDGQIINYALVVSPNGKILEIGAIIPPQIFNKYEDVLVSTSRYIRKING